MVGPIDGVLAIHNAFRADMAAIDAAAASAARGTSGLNATVERFVFFNESVSCRAFWDARPCRCVRCAPVG